MASESAMSFRPTVVSWNLTQACNLRCPHCYLTAGKRGPAELSLDEGKLLVEQLAGVGTRLLILTGGEPLLFPHLFELSRHATERGLFVVVGTNGMLVDASSAERLRDSGVRGVGISVDSIDPAKHDSFRGMKGSWERAVNAVDRCRDAGLGAAVQTSVLPMNVDEIPELCDFAFRKGAQAFNAYFLVCTGRGDRLTDITAGQYEKLLRFLIEAQGEHDGMMVRAKCAPHIKRLAYGIARGDGALRAGAAGLLASAGCPAGRSYLRITPDGDVTPCPYLPHVLGNVRASTLREIWEGSDLLEKLRALDLGGRCGACEFRELCVGCRARALAVGGDVLGEDPWCTYEPGDGPPVGPGWRDPAGGEDPWTPEALDRLARVPAFIRDRLKQGIEAYARSRGVERITPALMKEMRAGRDGRFRDRRHGRVERDV